MKDLTFIIPIHTLENDNDKYLKSALESVCADKNSIDSTIIFVGPTDVIEKASKLYETVGCKARLKLISNDDTRVETQINKGVMNTITKYFTILELDDKIFPYYSEIAKYYCEHMCDTTALLSITELCNTKNEVLSFVNELAWAMSFSNNLGELDNDCLMQYMDFHVTGAIIKTEDFIAVGGLKPSLKIASWYEFLLRLTQEHKKIYVIPKVLYRHTINREGSYMVESQKAISQEEGQWLIKTAQQEFLFKEDRNKTFSKE